MAPGFCETTRDPIEEQDQRAPARYRLLLRRGHLRTEQREYGYRSSARETYLRRRYRLRLSEFYITLNRLLSLKAATSTRRVGGLGSQS